jgi:WD40 repeat protein
VLKRVFLLVGLLLAACAQAGDPSVPAGPRNVVTQPAVEWVASGSPITLDTVAQVQPLGRLDNPTAPSTLFDHAFSPDGTLLAGLDNQELAVWDLISGQLVFSNTRRAEESRVFFAADKAEVYTVESSGLVTVYEAATGRSQTSFQTLADFAGQVAYYSEDGWLAVGNRTGQVQVWDPLERQSLVTIVAHDGPVQQMAFSGDGERLATLSVDHQIKVWDWRQSDLRATFTNDVPVLSLAFAPDGQVVAAGTASTIRLWSLATGDLAHVLPTGADAIQVMAFSPSGQVVVNGGQIADMQVWDVAQGKLAAQLPGVGRDRLSLAFAPNGDLLLTSVLGKGVTLWNLATLTGNTVNNAELDVGGVSIFAVDWTRDGRLLTLFGAEGAVYVWGVP